MSDVKHTDELSSRVRTLETAEPPVTLVYSDQNVSNPPLQAEMDAAFGGTAAQWRDGYMGIIDDNGAGVDVWFCVSKNDLWHAVKVGGGVLGTGTPPEIAYWTAVNTIGSGTDIEYVAGGGLDFQAGGAAPSNALVQCLDNVADALHIDDSGGQQYLRIRSTNASERIELVPAGTGADVSAPGTGGSSQRIGISAVASGNNCSAFGDSASASNNASTAIGEGATASGSNSVALGVVARAQATGAICVGTGSTAASNRSIVLGSSSQATAADVVAIGASFVASQANTAIIGARYDGATALDIGSGTLTPSAKLHIAKQSALTATQLDLLVYDHYTTGTAAAGFGSTAQFRLEDNAGAIQQASRNTVEWTNAVAANRSADWSIEVVSNASLIEMVSLDGLNTQPEICFNDGSNDIDFRIESDNLQHAIFVRGSDGSVGIGESNPANRVHVTEQTSRTNSVEKIVRVDHLSTGITANGFGSTEEWFLERPDGVTGQAFTRQITWTNATVVNRSSNVIFSVFSNASLSNMLTIDGLNTQPSIVMNEAGLSCDLRIESGVDQTAIFLDGGTSWLGIGVGTPNQMVEFEETEILEASAGDGYAAALRLDPGYSAVEETQTISRHNYIEMQNVSTSGTAALTDGCHTRFDAAVGTHCCLDSGTTKEDTQTVNAWLKYNVNGTIYYCPLYTSKT